MPAVYVLPSLSLSYCYNTYLILQIIGVPTALEVTPNKYRPWTQGFVMTLASVAVVAGTLAAGVFVKYHTWRWSYYLNAGVYGTTALLVLLCYHPPPTGLRRRDASVRTHLAQVDYLGILVFAGALASLLLGLTWGASATYAWTSAPVLGPLVAGAVGLVAFGVYETYVVTEGMLDHRLFAASRNFPILLFVCAIDGMLLLGVNVLFAQQIAIVFTQDAVQVAADLMPYLVTSAFGCLPAGYLMARTQSYRLLLVVALGWCSLFTGLMALLTPDRLSLLYAFSAMFGIGTAVTTVIPSKSLCSLYSHSTLFVGRERENTTIRWDTTNHTYPFRIGIQ